jgi:hypothetical protein
LKKIKVMRIVLDNVEPQYVAMLRELANALHFTLTETEIHSKRAEIDRRIQRLEANQTTLIAPDWTVVQHEADTDV